MAPEATILHKYKNGNVSVTILSDGTKIREWPDGEDQNCDYPESCDLKITQYCDLGRDGANMCPYCHEQSNKQGTHGDLDLIADIWANQLPGTELAIGGGNPLAHPQIEAFLRRVVSGGIIPNITMNSVHMKKYGSTVKRFQDEKLIYGLGISYRGDWPMDKLPDDIDYSNVVFHMILGVHTLDDCVNVIRWCRDRNVWPKLLLLGYKQYGNGIDYFNAKLQADLEIWQKENLTKLLMEWNTTISFDNLAIAQLNLKDHLEPEQWELLYQGEDGSHTFYVDAVKGEVARTSTSNVRFPIQQGDDIISIFNKVKLH